MLEERCVCAVRRGGGRAPAAGRGLPEVRSPGPGELRQAALVFAVKDECVFRLPAATGADFVLAGGQGRRQDPKTPV